jgi:hypothetical protein
MQVERETIQRRLVSNARPKHAIPYSPSPPPQAYTHPILAWKASYGRRRRPKVHRIGAGPTLRTANKKQKIFFASASIDALAAQIAGGHRLPLWRGSSICATVFFFILPSRSHVKLDPHRPSVYRLSSPMEGDSKPCRGAIGCVLKCIPLGGRQCEAAAPASGTMVKNKKNGALFYFFGWLVLGRATHLRFFPPPPPPTPRSTQTKSPHPLHTHLSARLRRLSHAAEMRTIRLLHTAHATHTTTTTAARAATTTTTAGDTTPSALPTSTST